MAEKDDDYDVSDDVDDEEDEEVNDLISQFEVLTYHQMKQALDIAKVTLMKKEQEEKFATKVEKKVEAMKAKFAASPSHIFNGNSVEKIAELENEYDFTDVSKREREEAKKWFQAVRPSSSRLYGPTVMSAYRLWLKWNLTTTGGKSNTYKGDLVRKREEEAGAAMAAVRLE